MDRMMLITLIIVIILLIILHLLQSLPLCENQNLRLRTHLAF